MGILGISLLTWAVYSDYCVETFLVYAGGELGAVFLKDSTLKELDYECNLCVLIDVVLLALDPCDTYLLLYI
jgi:hypothetical protein